MEDLEKIVLIIKKFERDPRTSGTVSEFLEKDKHYIRSCLMLEDEFFKQSFEDIDSNRLCQKCSIEMKFYGEFGGFLSEPTIRIYKCPKCNNKHEEIA